MSSSNDSVIQSYERKGFVEVRPGVWEKPKGVPAPKVSNPKPRERPAQLESGGEGKARSPGCPLVRFTLCRVRLLDVDAKYHSCKDLLDGLAIAGLIRGDKEGEITLEVNQAKVQSYEDEITLIEIIYEFHQ